MNKRVPPKLKKYPAEKQRRLDQLLEKNRDGTITGKEKAILQRLVGEAEKLMVANAQRLAEFSRGERVRPPTGAVPVTVWVQPQSAES